MGWTFTESSPVHLDWTQNFRKQDFRACPGLTHFWLGWSDWTFICRNEDGLNWAEANFVNGPGHSACSRTTKMRAKHSNIPTFSGSFMHLDWTDWTCLNRTSS